MRKFLVLPFLQSIFKLMEESGKTVCPVALSLNRSLFTPGCLFFSFFFFLFFFFFFLPSRRSGGKAVLTFLSLLFSFPPFLFLSPWMLFTSFFPPLLSFNLVFPFKGMILYLWYGFIYFCDCNLGLCICNFFFQTTALYF